MCGISGIFQFSQDRVIPQDLLHRMNETLRHRGPDDEGIFTGPGIGLGHRRLSIIDVVGGHQPIGNEDGTVWVLLNGEIYNYPALSVDLQARGHKFRTQSDTEAIVHLYEEYGEGCFSRLRGMFAIAIWDSKQQHLLLARDRVGKKPLYYYLDNDMICFASELKAIIASGCAVYDVDPLAICDYFSFGYIPAPKTIYKSIRKLLPAHYLLVSRDGMREAAYWNLSFANTAQRPEQEWSEAIREALSEATRIRLMSEVPLGAFLSGGVDSSSVVALMSKVINRPVTTCSIAFAQEEYNEASYARQVAEQFHTDHYEDMVEPSALAVIDKLVWHFDEPFADSSAIPTYYVSKIARQHVTVALGGDGGDEIFAGYRRYLFDIRENQFRALMPLAARSIVFGSLGRLYPHLAWAPRPFRAKATLQSLSRSPLEGYFNSISIFRPDEKARLFTPEFKSCLLGYDSLNVLKGYYDEADTDDQLSRIQYIDIKTYLPDDILTKVDRMSMAASLELRAPLLDQEVMKLGATIPSGLRIKGRIGKYILKKAFESILPSNILYRPKQGFAVPVAQWFRRDLKQTGYDAIMGQDDGILNKDYLARIWKQHQAGTSDRSAYLWSVLMFRKWQAAFQNGSAA